MLYPENNSPFGFDTEDTLKVTLTPYKVIEQSVSNATSSESIRKTQEGDAFTFLLPSQFAENIVHEWANYDSLGTRAVQKADQLQKLAKSIMTTAKGQGTGLGRVITQKLDTPLAFSDSNRRDLMLTVYLADQGDTYRDVFVPVRKLQEYSCAVKKDGFNFEMPYIFTVETDGSKLIYIENAALLSVQPTYYGPYRGGYPSKCELTLNFKDMAPLYRSSFTKS